MKYFYIHRLGCPKNDVDAEYIAGFLIQNGLTEIDNPSKADLLIVNSCGFIEPAKEESIAALLTLAEIKKENEGVKLAVTGCLSQRYAIELSQEIPELDGIFGLDEFTGLEKLIGDGFTGPLISRNKELIALPRYPFPRSLRREEPFAYLKISDGCDNRCSYCAIPDIRGPFRSRLMEDIVKEAGFLIAKGKKELILVSQETTAYGLDLYGQRQLLPLLDRLSALKGEFWIRLMYLHPARLTAEVIDYMIDNRQICNYFDLPLQHIDDHMLEAMKRRLSRDQIERLLDKIRGHSDRQAVRTNFIVGFPGETEEQFTVLCRFVEQQRFDRVGVFVYSAEEGTPAAALPDQVDEEEKERRYHRLMLIQQEIAFDNNDEEVGKRYEVIVDGMDGETGQFTGRTRFDAPEIDQIVRLGNGPFESGEILTARITASDGYDLIGESEEV